uniref:Topors PWI-like domain-containing protein n=1 Tax=Gongylonema pulchrum TaxID=637853 RepID=A0A183D1S3_9BILA
LIYDRQLHRFPLVAGSSTLRRGRISPQYFRDNEITERPRIEQFVRRDLTALIPNLSNLETIARRVYDLAMYYQIMSPQFTALLAKEFPVLLGDEHSVVVPEFLDHFAELLFAFTISGESLDVFDQNSEYLRFFCRLRFFFNIYFLNGNFYGFDAEIALFFR